MRVNWISTSYSLQANYTSLQSEYDALNQTYTDLQTELTTLQERITRSENALNSDRIVMFIFIITVAALIAFIVYMKRKKEEPYVVIRKETVSVKKEGSWRPKPNAGNKFRKSGTLRRL